MCVLDVLLELDGILSYVFCFSDSKYIYILEANDYLGS